MGGKLGTDGKAAISEAPAACGVVTSPLSTPVSFNRSPPSTGTTLPAAKMPAGWSTFQRWKAMRWNRWETNGP